MSRQVGAASAWMYRGIWGVLARWFRVPQGPPSLPGGPGVRVESFRPAEGFLRYLKFQFWILLLLLDIAVVFVLFVISLNVPWLAVFLIPVAVLLIVLPDIVAYLAIHLRYDTTWYVLTDRSMRVRTGIWTIHEATITFENVQNVTVESGPLERWFGIANVLVETAGGGSGGEGKHEPSINLHQGRIEGIADADRIRALILSRVRQSRTTGLGDDIVPASGWTSDHIAALREIRNALRSAPGA